MRVSCVKTNTIGTNTNRRAGRHFAFLFSCPVFFKLIFRSDGTLGVCPPDTTFTVVRRAFGIRHSLVS